MLQYTLREGKRLNLGIDVANAKGWSFGGPWITDADASKEMFWKKYEVKGGGAAERKHPVYTGAHGACRRECACYNINFPAHDKENRGADGLFTTLNWKTKPSGIEGKVELVPLEVY